MVVWLKVFAVRDRLSAQTALFCEGSQARFAVFRPITAQTARDWGVVAEVVPDGTAVARARELADLYLAKPEVTRRNTRIHFIQPLKEALVRETGYGLALEGASASALVKSFSN